MSAFESSSRTPLSDSNTSPSISHPEHEAQPLQGGVLPKDKRRLLALNKKEDGQFAAMDSATDSRTLSPTSASGLLPSPPLTMSPPEHRPSPRGSPRLYPAGAASPGRRVTRSTSPGLHSPASSQIFERNVQEPESLPAIPAHIQTEDHIPAALDASSIAITDNHLNPDEVEIIMHPAHQPASVAVAHSVHDSVHDSMYSPSLAYDDASAMAHSDVLDAGSASNYGALDTTDPRRLSFISFADVVMAEHAEHVEHTDADAQGTHFMSLSQTAARSPSPMRSLASSHVLGASPPGARSPGSPGSPSARGFVASAGMAAGTASGTGTGTGELQIETMRQALRRTGSGDLGARLQSQSQPLSAVSMEDAPGDRAPSK